MSVEKEKDVKIEEKEKTAKGINWVRRHNKETAQIKELELRMQSRALNRKK